LVEGTPKQGWDHLPVALRERVVARFGAEVVRSRTQQGGFTPGVATRVRFVDGSDAFVKAVSASTNVDSARMHRHEAEIVEIIGSDPAVPRLLEVFDDGDWVALVFELVEGEHPAVPWNPTELGVVCAALQRMHDRLTPSPVATGPLVGHASYDFDRWRRFADEPQRAARHGLDPEDVEVLADLADDVAELVVGDTLLHGDLRADQILITDERVVFLDWPHACRGPGWADTVLMMPSILRAGSRIDIDHIIGLSPELQQAPRRAVLSLLSAMTGYLLWQSDEPPPANLPTVRTYQLTQARAVLPELVATARGDR
jgi:aminoglycoside phosphotransferase (APT) family kinase protein